MPIPKSCHISTISSGVIRNAVLRSLLAVALLSVVVADLFAAPRHVYAAANPGLLVSELLTNPAGSDSPFE